MERFVAEELIEKAAAVEVETVPGKVFFTGKADVKMIQHIKSAERMFLLVMRGPPINLAGNQGTITNLVKRDIIGDPSVWLEVVKVWKILQTHLPQKGVLSEKGGGQKRKSEHHPAVGKSKICKRGTDEETDETCHDETDTDTMTLSGNTDGGAVDTSELQELHREVDEAITFRVSCRCSGANTKHTSAQEVGRIIGLSLSKLFGWKPDLRCPALEVFVHINDMYSVVGFPIERRPLASRNYIQNTGLRSTIAWAMASLAEIGTASHVLDPMCGVGTILLEAAKEWHHASYLGIDISDSQLTSARGNVEKAGVTDSVAFLKGSVLNLPILSESMDVVVSDVPFGKKFMCSKDMKELLPDIIREMERVLCVGGALVLLLSQKLHYHLKKNFHFKSMNAPGIKDEGKNPIPEDCEEECSTSSKDLLQHRNCFVSLVYVESHSVSLGVTEAVIFKCKKTET
ncbi:U6 snRNA (guanine-N(2))-methyltransferase THUMPD2 [Gastrophryne carolinensis]